MQMAPSRHRQVLSKQAEVGLVGVVQEFLRLDKRRIWLARKLNRRPTWEELAAATNTDARCGMRISLTDGLKGSC